MIATRKFLKNNKPRGTAKFAATNAEIVICRLVVSQKETKSSRARGRRHSRKKSLKKVRVR